MSKQTQKKETRKENGSVTNVSANVAAAQTGNKKSFTKSKTNKASSSIDSPEEWPTLGETVNNIKDQRSDTSNGDINNSESRSSKKKSPKKIGQLNEQPSSEAQAHGNGSTSGDQEDDDSSTNKDDAQSSSSSERPTADEENGTPTANGRRKKGSKNRWRPLIIETPSSKHYERKRGQRSRRRDNSLTNYENVSRGDDENKGGPPDKSYRGSRRGRGRGSDSFSSYDRSGFRGRSRNYNGNRAPHEDYPAPIAYYVDYDPITDQTVPAVQPAINGDSISPTMAQVAPAAFVLPTSAMQSAAFVAPFFTPYAALPQTLSPEAVRSSIRNQVDYYFSEENLQKDFFLRRKMDSEGYLPVSLIASFQRVQLLTQDMEVLIDAMLESTEIDLSEDRKKVRTKNDPLKWPIFDLRYKQSAN